MNRSSDCILVSNPQLIVGGFEIVFFKRGNQAKRIAALLDGIIKKDACKLEIPFVLRTSIPQLLKSLLLPLSPCLQVCVPQLHTNARLQAALRKPNTSSP